MQQHKLWKGAPGSGVKAPGSVPEREKRDHPEVTINGTTYRWEPGQTDGIPEEALDIWRAYLEANE